MLIIASEDYSEAKYREIITNSLVESKYEAIQTENKTNNEPIIIKEEEKKIEEIVGKKEEPFNEEMSCEIRFTSLIYEREISNMEDGNSFCY